MRLADTPTGKHDRIIGPSGTTRLGTDHHRPPALAYYYEHWDWVKPTTGHEA
ncbi:hypothetical protein P4S55_22560 [Shewanella sp. PP-Sp27a-2]